MSFLIGIRLAAHRVINHCDVKKVIAYTPNSVELCRVTYACDLMRMCVEFWDKRENVKPRKIKFMRKCRMVKFGQNLNFFYISDDETNFTVGIISQNLATTLNFVEFRDSQNFMFFKAPRVVRDTWRI